MITSRDLKIACNVWKNARLNGLDPGPIDSKWHLVLTLARRRACMAPDTGVIVDQESVIHRLMGEAAGSR